MQDFRSRLTSIGIHRPTLDDVFIKLTGRAIRDAEMGDKDQMKQMMSIRRRFR
jgi:ABC-2 type transport system ATP-binding protein